ncbi:MAG TPA: cysteine desulfurase family protein [Vicinamibacterales bacterium]|nr:cysteine desulfurase family protein [Vicinamibacterales bacterium]
MRIYLDYNATSPPDPSVTAEVARLMRDVPGNPSSIHAFGQRARAAVDEARSRVAQLIGAETGDVVFTSGGTEADNLAIRGAAQALEPTGRRHLITSGIEHEAVLTTCRALTRRGWRLTELRATADGLVLPDALRAALADDTALVSIMLANNEVGTIQPIAELAAVARAAGALFHTDAVQAVGRIPVSTSALGVDLLSLSGHKFAGPKGTGALWVRRGVRLVSTETGGRQERSRRAGTENVPALGGLGVAAARARDAIEAAATRLARLRDHLEAGVLATIPDTVVNGAAAPRVPNTTSISFDGVEAESLLIALDLEGIAVSTGSACSSGTLEPSHVLRAMGHADSRARHSIRFSLGSSTTDAEIDTVLSILPALVGKLRRLGQATAALR